MTCNVGGATFGAWPTRDTVLKPYTQFEQARFEIVSPIFRPAFEMAEWFDAQPALRGICSPLPSMQPPAPPSRTQGTQPQPRVQHEPDPVTAVDTDAGVSTN